MHTKQLKPTNTPITILKPSHNSSLSKTIPYPISSNKALQRTLPSQSVQTRYLTEKHPYNNHISR